MQGQMTPGEGGPRAEDLAVRAMLDLGLNSPDMDEGVRGEMEEGRGVLDRNADGAVGSARKETHIHDLPEDCMARILRCVGGCAFQVRRHSDEKFVVRYTLACALVCRRWRSLADGALARLDLGWVDREVVRVVGERFGHLTALALTYNWHNNDAILDMADKTPHLQDLEIRVPENSMSNNLSKAKNLPEALKRWRALERLNLGNHLNFGTPEYAAETLQAAQSLSQLHHLSFTFNFQPHLTPPLFAHLVTMTRLSTLHLVSPALPPTTPASLMPHALRRLVLQHFEGSEIPSSFGLLQSLEDLCVDVAPSLRALPLSLGDLSRLTSLQVFKCPELPSLPHTISQLTSLQVLRLASFHPSWEWPEPPSNLRALQRLWLSNLRGPVTRTSFTSWRFPREYFGQLTSLQNLSVRGMVGQLAGPGGLPNLQKLDLEECGGGIFPSSSSCQLTCLRELEIHNCSPFPRLPETLTALTRLTIEWCVAAERGRVEEFLPNSLTCLSSLAVCKIGGLHWLQSLPEGLSEWTRLQSLEIARCPALTKLPRTTWAWQALTRLTILECEALGELPKELEALPSLRELSVVGCNRLRGLPCGLVSSSCGLRLLDVRLCPLFTLLPEETEALGALGVLRTWGFGERESPASRRVWFRAADAEA